MKKEIANSRRNFLSTLALLSSGTVLAGSSSNLFDTSKAGNASLKKSWAAFVRNYGASGFVDFTNSVAYTPEPVKGHSHKAGETVSFTSENLLAQPTWIYWDKNSSHPDDVLVSFFESSYPHKKVKSINRFELMALLQLPAEKQMLRAICSKPLDDTKDRLNVKTCIGKRKNVQDVTLIGNNNNVMLKQQFYYNV